MPEVVSQFYFVETAGVLGGHITMSIKRSAYAAILLAVFVTSTFAYAQDQVIIARPLDGATVREKVRIVVPGSSVPSGGFIAVFIDGRFRAGISNADENDGSYVYIWDTKAPDPDPNLPEQERQPREGKHTIKVQVCNAEGRRVGRPKEITVYVKNKADLPSNGVLLRYAQRLGQSVDYRYKVSSTLKNIQGATEIAATVGEAFEQIEMVVRRTVEDLRPDGTALVRQKIAGSIRYLEAGRMVPLGLTPKAAYNIEDKSGRVVYVMGAQSEGALVTIDLPNMPARTVRVGDTWTSRDKVLRNPITGESVVLNTTSVVEGAEWHDGYPCVKIVTTFSGTGKSPFPQAVKEVLNITGQTVTYFAYEVGKLISSVTTATVEGEVESSLVSSFSQKLVEASGSQYATSMLSSASSGIGNIGSPMEAPPPGVSETGIGFGTTSAGTGASRTAPRVPITFEVKQVLELAR